MSTGESLSYVIRRASARPELRGDWDSPAWRDANVLDVANFLPGSGHEPVTRAKLLYDGDGIYLFFSVQDQYVRCVTTEYQGPVYRDACVEFFVQPRPDKGYFNFEMNCGGTLLLRNVTDPTRVGQELAEYTNVPWELASRVRVYHSMPGTVEPEFEEPTAWCVEYFVPFALFEAYTGPIGDPAGQVWRGNFYKCAESNSHPHFATWAPITGAVNFHRPDCFAPIVFEA